MKLVAEEIGGAEARGHIAEDVEKIHRAWTNSLPLPIALWTRPCATGENGSENGGENGGENGNDAGAHSQSL
jgi:hypothetical protein